MARVFWLCCFAAALAGCGGGGGGGGVVPPPGPARELTGYLLRPLRTAATADNLAAQRTPLAGLTVAAYALPGTGAALGSTTADNWGRFSFAESQALPSNRSLLLVAKGAGRVVSAVVNTDVAGQLAILDETSHLAALAIRANEGSSVTAAKLGLYQIAARRTLGSMVSANPSTDFSAEAQQVAASSAAVEVRRLVRTGEVQANSRPVGTGLTLSPTQLPAQGGTVRVDLDLADSDASVLQATALLWSGAGEAPTAVRLNVTDGHATGTVTLPANSGAQLKLYLVSVGIDDGVNPVVLPAMRSVAVLGVGSFTLDIAAVTLFDEVPTRAMDADAVVRRWRSSVRRGDGRRQVNPNQSVRDVTVSVDDVGSLSGVTDTSGLLRLTVPMSAIGDGVLGLRAKTNNRATYHQYLLLPPSSQLNDGGVVEVDLVMAKAEDWQKFASALKLPGASFTKVPLLSAFNVRSDFSLSGVTPMATLFRSIAETPRTDDGDWFASGLNAGEASVRTTFCDPRDPVLTYPAGPSAVSLAVGEVVSLSAIYPPS